MNGHPLKCSLDDRATLERAREVSESDTVESREQTDIRGRRVLVLNAADPLESSRNAEICSFQQELARQQSPVQFGFREKAFGGGFRHDATVRQPLEGLSEFLANGRSDFGAEQLDRAHHLVVRQRADAELHEESVVLEDLVLEQEC